MGQVVHAVGKVGGQSLLRVAFGAEQVVISAGRPDVPIAVDGDGPVAPFEFTSRPGALRLRVPTDPAPRTVDVLLSW